MNGAQYVMIIDKSPEAQLKEASLRTAGIWPEELQLNTTIHSLADPTRGGNAVDTRTAGNEFWVGEGTVFLTVDIEILYHTNRQDPGANT